MHGLAIAAVAVAACAAPAAAQSRTQSAPRATAPREPRIEIGGGGGLTGAIALGEATASLRANSLQATVFPLFTVETRLDRAAFATVHGGYRLTGALSAEGRVTRGNPSLRAILGADAESAPGVDATLPTTEYLFEGGVVLKLVPLAWGRTMPFVAGGAGLARHVYDERALVENGRYGYLGGGVLHPLGGRSGVSRLNVRLDARVQMLDGGIVEGRGVSPRAAVSGGLVASF